MRKRFFYRSSFAALNLLALLALLVMAGVLVWVGRDALARWRTDPDADGLLPVEEPPGMARGGDAPAPGLDGPVVMGSPSRGVTVDPFAWAGEEDLIREATGFFAARRDWEACLYLAALSATRDEEHERRKIGLVESYYRDAVSMAVLREIEAGDLKRLCDLSETIDVLNALPGQLAVTLLHNVRVRLRARGVPPEVVDILSRALVERIDDAFLKMIAHELFERTPDAAIDYGRAESFMLELLGGGRDQRYLERYLQACLTDLYDRWKKADKRTFRWILRSSENMAHAKALLSAVDSGEERLSVDEYEALSPLQRWALARFARTRLRGRAQSGFFRNFHLWRGMIVPDGKLTPDMIRELRKETRWVRELDARRYERALTAASESFKLVTGGEEMPDQLLNRFETMIELERKLWLELVNKFRWERLIKEEWRAAFKEGRSKREAAPDVFWKSLYRLFPASIRSERQTLLMSACMINRGLDPRVFLGVDKTLLEKYIPTEEFHDGKSK